MIMKKVTIQDIADALGVSRNTVSKAINNSDGIADDTREKILQKAIEMGYKQFSYVSTLATLRNFEPTALNSSAPGFAGEVALLTTAFFNTSHFASLMLDKFQRELSQLGYILNTYRVTEENLKSQTLPFAFDPGRVSAIICIEMFDRSYDEMVCALGLPTLFVDGPCKRNGLSLPADQLYMDSFTEISRFLNEMIKKGVRRFGFIGDYEHCQSFYERYCAFRFAMLVNGIPVEEKHILKYNSLHELREPLDRLNDLPELFVCANDFIAVDVLRILAERGVKVPEDVMIFGFDDSAESRMSRPPLSTVHIHTQVMAFSALQLLLSRMKEPSLEYRIVYTQTDLIERESTRQ